MDADSPPDIVVIAAGEAPTSLPEIERALVVAADAGVATALGLGLGVDVAVGDFDSLDDRLVARLEDVASQVMRVSQDKDQTDLELALDVAVERGPARILVAGIEGGRPDHALANLLLASADRYSGLDIELHLARGRGWVVTDRLRARWQHGSLLSVLPVHGDAVVSIEGVRWPLERSRLVAGSSRGVSNVVTHQRTELVVHEGTAICLLPTSSPTSE